MTPNIFPCPGTFISGHTALKGPRKTLHFIMNTAPLLRLDNSHYILPFQMNNKVFTFRSSAVKMLKVDFALLNFYILFV